jgi:hypothetical protein
MGARVTFRQMVEEELQTLFVCPDALQQQQQQCLTGRLGVTSVAAVTLRPDFSTNP